MRELFIAAIVVFALAFGACYFSSGTSIAAQCELRNYFVVNNKLYGCKLYKHLGDDE